MTRRAFSRVRLDPDALASPSRLPLPSHGRIVRLKEERTLREWFLLTAALPGNKHATTGIGPSARSQQDGVLPVLCGQVNGTYGRPWRAITWDESDSTRNVRTNGCHPFRSEQEHFARLQLPQDFDRSTRVHPERRSVSRRFGAWLVFAGLWRPTLDTLSGSGCGAYSCSRNDVYPGV